MATINPSAITGYLARIETLNGSKKMLKSFMCKVQDQFVGLTKALTDTLMTKLLTIRYDGHRSIRDHIMQLIDITNQGFLVQFTLHSLPAQYDQFKLVYNTQKEKLNQNKLEVAHFAETNSCRK
ncbi:hypothetical protein AMTRI_Chr02g220540 [Amborella trichopoda]